MSGICERRAQPKRRHAAGTAQAARAIDSMSAARKLGRTRYNPVILSGCGEPSVNLGFRRPVYGTEIPPATAESTVLNSVVLYPTFFQIILRFHSSWDSGNIRIMAVPVVSGKKSSNSTGLGLSLDTR